MITNIYTLFDTATKAFTRPFLLHNDGQAIRVFQNMVNEEGENKGDVARNPDQFTLYLIGSFDDQTAQIKQQDPLSLGNGKTYELPREKTEIFNLLNDIINMLKEEKQ